jgi:hypothetical protein
MQTSTEPGEAALPAAQPCALATPKVAALARQLLGYEACSPPFPRRCLPNAPPERLRYGATRAVLVSRVATLNPLVLLTGAAAGVMSVCGFWPSGRLPRPCRAPRRVADAPARTAQELCRAGDGRGAGGGGAQRRWAAIVFAQRKLVVLALHALVAACPALGFLRSAPLMGYGSTGTATTTPTLAVRAAPPAP